MVLVNISEWCFSFSHNQIQVRSADGRGFLYLLIYLSVYICLFLFIWPLDETKNKRDLKFDTHTNLDLFSFGKKYPGGRYPLKICAADGFHISSRLPCFQGLLIIFHTLETMKPHQSFWMMKYSTFIKMNWIVKLFIIFRCSVN